MLKNEQRCIPPPMASWCVQGYLYILTEISTTEVYHASRVNLLKKPYSNQIMEQS